MLLRGDWKSPPPKEKSGPASRLLLRGSG